MTLNLTKTHLIQCPYCWEKFDLVVDCSQEEQSYIEDCWVCCRPIEFTVTVDQNNDVEVLAKSQDE